MRIVLIVVIICIMATLQLQAQSVEISATLRADQIEYFQTGWAFGGETIDNTAWFSYSEFGEPGNDIIAVETPIVILQAIGNGANIQSIKLELTITKDFYLTSEIVCEGVINL